MRQNFLNSCWLRPDCAAAGRATSNKRSLKTNLAIIVEDRLVGRNFFWVELYGRVVHLGVLILQQADDLCTSPDGWAIAMSRHDVNGTIGVESRIESHSCAYADVLNLSFVVDGAFYRMPSQLGNRAICQCINPSLIDSVGDAIGKDSGT